MNWATIEDAIHTWVTGGSGLGAANVIWAGQNGPRPAGAFISIRAAVTRIGQDWADVQDAPAPAPGAEIEHKVRGVREIILSLQAFPGIGGAATGALAAVGVLESVLAYVNLPTARDALNAAGVGVASFGPIQAIDGVLGSSVFEPRATLEIRAFATSEISELGTYVQTVEITDLTNGGTFTVDIP